MSFDVMVQLADQLHQALADAKAAIQKSTASETELAGAIAAIVKSPDLKGLIKGQPALTDPVKEISKGTEEQLKIAKALQKSQTVDLKKLETSLNQLLSD
jgi:hypothetical protein